MKRALVVVLLSLLCLAQANAAPRGRTSRATKAIAKTAKIVAPRHKRGATAKRTPLQKPMKAGAARVAYAKAGELRPARNVIGRREEPLTLEEDIAKQIEKLLRGPLRRGACAVTFGNCMGSPPAVVRIVDPVRLIPENTSR